MPTSTTDIETLLPHRGTMLLIAEIVACDGQKAVTRSVVKPTWPLTGPQGVDALILIELVAQTAGVNNGWELSRRQGAHVDHRGWIVGIKSARLFVDVVAIGATIETTSENAFEYDSFREIVGIAKIDDQVAAEVVLQLMQAR